MKLKKNFFIFSFVSIFCVSLTFQSMAQESFNSITMTTAAPAPELPSFTILNVIPNSEVINESFDSWPPAGWSVIDNSGIGSVVWQGSSTCGYSNDTGGTGGFADANSDCFGSSAFDTELFTPSFDLTLASSAKLEFKSAYENYAGNDSARVMVSGNGGTDWDILQDWNTDHSGPDTVELDLSAYAGKSNVIISFQYDSNGNTGWYWYWQIDDVLVTMQGLSLQPENQYVDSCPCPSEPFPQELTIYNFSGFDDSIDLTYTTTGHGNCVGPSQIGPISDGNNETFSLKVTPYSGIKENDIITCTVTAQATTSGYTDEASVEVYIAEKSIFDPVAGWQNETITGSLSAQWGMGAVGSNPAATGEVGYYVGGLAPGTTLRPDLQMYDPDAASWTQLQDMPNPRFTSVAGFIDGLLYVAGGFDTTFTATDDLQVYNPASDSWNNSTPMALPTPLGGGTGGVGTCSSNVGECLFHVGGAPSGSFASSVTSTYQYDPLTNTWSQLDNKPLGSSPDGNLIGTGVGCMGYIFVGGDYRGYHDFFRLDATQSSGSQWFTAANIPPSAGAMSPALVCEEELESLFLIGGDPYGYWSGAYTDTVYRYHIPSDTWSGPMNQRLNENQTGAVGLYMHDKLWSFGGTRGSGPVEPVPHESLKQLPCENCFYWPMFLPAITSD